MQRTAALLAVLALACGRAAPATSPTSTHAHATEKPNPTPEPTAAPSSAPAGPVDSDRDGIPDAADNCPTKPGPRLGGPRKEGCPQRLEPPQGIYVIGPVCFDKNKAAVLGARDRVVNERNRDELNVVIAHLQRYPTARIVVRGHSAYGEPKRLAPERANAVQKFLLERHIDPSRIELEESSESEPPKPDAGDRQLELNRCVRFKIIDPSEARDGG